MAVGRLERRPSRFGQFLCVAIMFMLLKETQESAGRAVRDRASRGMDRGAAGVGASRPTRSSSLVAGHAAASAHLGRPLDRDAGSVFAAPALLDPADPGADPADPGAGSATTLGPDGPGPGGANDTRLLAPPRNDDGTLLFPSDVAGTYKGHWTLVRALGADGAVNASAGAPLPGMEAFAGEGGVGAIVLQIKSTFDPETFAQSVKAEVAVRDGSYITEHDVHLRAYGVYAEPTGMLALTSESRLDHTFSGRGGGSESESESESDSDSESSSYRQALRLAARDVVDAPFDEGSTAHMLGLRPETVPGAPGLSRFQRTERLRALDDAEPGAYPAECAFSLRAWVAPGAFDPIDRDAVAFEDRDDALWWDEDDLEGSEGSGSGGRKRTKSDGSSAAARRKARAGWSASEIAARRRAAWRARALGLPESGAASGLSSPGPTWNGAALRTSSPGEGGNGRPTLTGTLRSEDCGIELRVTARWYELGSYYGKATRYAAMVALIAPAQIWLLVRQAEHAGTQAGMAKVSLLCVGMQAVLDSYQCLLHLTAGIVVEPLFHSFGVAAFFQFALFSVFEMRVLLQIWKARRPNGEQNWLEIRRDLSALYSRFYGGFLLGFFLIYWLHTTPWVVALLANSYWIPQIAWSAWCAGKKPLLPSYVAGISFTRLLVPLYLFGCPRNFVRSKPQYWVCWALVAWVAAQCAALAAQHRWGPRCFVPAWLLPEVYDYHRVADEATLRAAGAGDEEMGEAGGVDCVICMAPVNAKARGERMLTPCNHFFHVECLERWMEVKMECPTCRGGLPAL